MDWSAKVKLPEPGKVHLHTLKVGNYARFPWDGRIVRVERISPAGITVSEEIERKIMDKIVKTRHRYVISRFTNVTKARPPK